MLKEHYALCLQLLLFSQSLSAQPIHFLCLSKQEPFVAMDSAFEGLWGNQPTAILLGIAEGVDVNQQLYVQMIKLCSTKGRIRHIVCERSHGEAFLFNRYLESGDERYLSYEYEWSKEMQRSFRELYEYNKGLKDESKILFIGIDAVQYISPVVLALQELMPQGSPPREIAAFVDSIRSLVLPFRKSMNQSPRQLLKEKEDQLEFLRDEIRSKANYYKAFFGYNFKHIEMIINSNASFLSPGKRNSEMFYATLRAVELFEIKNGIFGMFGTNHTSLDHEGTLGSRLKNIKSSPFRNKTHCVNTHYEDSDSFYGKVLPIESSELDIVYGKNAETEEQRIIQAAKCDNFILKVDPGSVSLKKRLDYLIYVTGAGPISILRPHQ